MSHSTFGPLNRATTTFRGLNKATTTFGVTHATDDSLDSGSYVITGQDALFPVSRQMVAAQGSYSLTGQDALLPVTRKTVAEQGTYSITGQDTAFPASLIIGAEQGSYSVTGQDTAFPVTRKLGAAQGTYTITGQAADFPVTDASSLLLDSFSGAAAAYSLRKLRDAYAGSAIRVRRSSDNSEQDIGFDGNDLDESALTTFVGAGDGFVVTWYDQSGNGVDGSESTAGQQLKIVSSGSVITVNGKPAMAFDSFSAMDELSSSISGASPWTFFGVITRGTSTSHFRVFNNGSNNYAWSQTNDTAVFVRDRFDAETYDPSAAVNNTDQHLLSSLSNASGEKSMRVDGGAVSTSTLAFGTNTNDIVSLIQFDGDDVSFQELIYYTDDKSTDQSGIEGNINTYYSIF